VFKVNQSLERGGSRNEAFEELVFKASRLDWGDVGNSRQESLEAAKEPNGTPASAPAKSSSVFATVAASTLCLRMAFNFAGTKCGGYTTI